MEEAKENGTGGNGSLFVTTTAFNLNEHQENRTKIKETQCHISFSLKIQMNQFSLLKNLGKKPVKLKWFRATTVF